MSSVKASDFVQDRYTNGATNDQSQDAEDKSTYMFDSKKQTELQRLDEQHHCLLSITGNRLVHAPIQRPKKILDIGCGTGIATVALAKEFPEAEVIGLDINPVPPIHEKPSNVTYIQTRIEDVVAKLDGSNESKAENETDSETSKLQSESFDYIFGRYLMLAVSNWPAFTRACTNLLSPGGWLEVQEIAALDFYNAASPLRPISSDWEWPDVINASGLKSGVDHNIGKNLHSHFLSSGLNSVSSEHYPAWGYPYPAKPESERMGTYHRSFSAPFYPVLMKTHAKGYPEEQVERWEKHINEVWGGNVAGEGFHYRFYTVCGRKPAGF